MIAIPATYRNGSFEPRQPVDLAEGTEVSVIVDETDGLRVFDPADDRPMTAEEFAEWEADMREADKYRMSDEEYAQSVAELLERKREQLRIQAVIWE